MRLALRVDPRVVVVALAISIGFFGIMGTLWGAEIRVPGFNLDAEATFPAFFSATLLLAAATVTLLLYVEGKDTKDARALIAMAVFFAFMSFDELLAIRESLEDATGVDWQILYLPLVLVAGVAFFLVLRSLLAIPLAAGAWAIGAGVWFVAQLFEKLQWSGPEFIGWMVIPEETFEMAGSSSFAIAMLLALRAELAPYLAHSHGPVQPSPCSRPAASTPRSAGAHSPRCPTGAPLRCRLPDVTGSSGGDRVEVSVLVPVLNEAAGIRETVSAMQGQRYDGEVEFLFLDGASEDDTRGILAELARDDDRLRVLDNPARQVPHALNIGLRHVRGAFVARMDAHTLYPPDYLALGVDRLERGDVEWASGPQLAHGSGVWSRRIEVALGSLLGVGGATFRRADRETEVDSGFTGVWRRETLERHGGWDEDWPVNEDGELAARLREAGGRIVCVPEMGARYAPRDSLRALARQYWRYGEYRAKTSRRHPESMRRSHVLAPALVLSGAASLLPIGRLSWLPRSGLGAYSLAVAVTSLRLAPAPRHREGPALAAVFATMHVAWGAGFLLGCVRFGPPLASLRGL